MALPDPHPGLVICYSYLWAESEVNDFIWPGPDLRHVPGSQPPRFDFGVLPPGLFRKVRDQVLALHAARRVQPVPPTQ